MEENGGTRHKNPVYFEKSIISLAKTYVDFLVFCKNQISNFNGKLSFHNVLISKQEMVDQSWNFTPVLFMQNINQRLLPNIALWETHQSPVRNEDMALRKTSKIDSSLSSPDGRMEGIEGRGNHFHRWSDFVFTLGARREIG